MKNKCLVGCIIATVLCVWMLIACADEAADITKSCKFKVKGGGSKVVKAATDRDYQTYGNLPRDGYIEFTAGGKPIGSVMVQFYERATAVEIWAKVGEEWGLVAERGSHMSDWVALPEGATAARVTGKDKSRLFLAELSVYGTGDRPAHCPEWVDLDKADLMLVACHPDDELLWFGGLLPTYAGERKMRVQVVYGVPSTPRRRLELLDGLWHCGVTAYPAFLNLPDRFAKTLQQAYKRWNKGRMQEKLTGLIRRYRPDVVVTHDFKGEYGHGGHRAIADSVKASVGYAADSEKYKDSLNEYGSWEVKKLYIHLWNEGKIQFDWHQPLTAFGGKDGLTVATEALALHKSQTARGWEMEDGGACDNSLFGLYLTRVGEDTAKNDLFEHVTDEQLAEDPRIEIEEDTDLD